MEQWINFLLGFGIPTVVITYIIRRIINNEDLSEYETDEVLTELEAVDEPSPMLDKIWKVFSKDKMDNDDLYK